MSPVFVVVTDVLGDEAFQMTMIENDHMIELVSAAVANPALGNAILPGTSEARSFRLGTPRLDGADHLFIEVRGSVENQVFRSGIEGNASGNC